ncbi:MAG: FAD-dependent oxidoreductase, partial [Gammaproteobacteria bacterium]
AVRADRDRAGDVILIAAGSYTSLLTKTIGLRVPVAPVKGYSLTVPLNGWPNGPRVPVIDDHLHAAVCPLGDRLRIAGTAEFAGYDRRLTRARIDNLFRLVNDLYPTFSPYLDHAAALPWTGLRPMTPDGVGIMGRTPIPGLYLNTGHGHLGWTMAAGAGRLVADEIAGVEPELALAPYHFERGR